MICPKCGLEQLEAVECARCAVIVARYRRRASQQPTAGGQARVGAASRSNEAVLDLRERARRLGPWLVVAAVCWWVYPRPAHQTPRIPEPSPPVQAADARAVPIPSGPPQSVSTLPPAPAWPPPVAAEVEALPPASCPLLAHGFGAAPSRDRIRSGWYTKAGDYALARSEQDAAMAPMFVYVYTDWCQYCKAF